eukprot:766585-Hanusia_phi.AAC.5
MGIDCGALTRYAACWAFCSLAIFTGNRFFPISPSPSPTLTRLFVCVREWAKLLCQQLLRPGRGLFRRTTKGNRVMFLADEESELAHGERFIGEPRVFRLSALVFTPAQHTRYGEGFGSMLSSSL